MPSSSAAVALSLVCLLVGCGTEGSSKRTKETLAGTSSSALSETVAKPVSLDVFFSLFADDADVADRSLGAIETNWQDGYAIMLLELVSLLPRDRAGRVLALVRSRAGKEAKVLNDLFHWVWRIKPTPHPEYPKFKEALYSQIDKRFATYFDDHTEAATIRLDEVRWGGVRRDGIPPLSNPTMITVAAASYLADGDIVFGLSINGDARAYPKRILAWHEMFKDTVGDVSVNGVYCTLCGSMILYKTEHNGIHYELGTSGFLYRSNKLMYDHATESMWSTLKGEPVIGPLVGKGIVLDTLSVVTTNWGEWKRLHPRTTVLSLETGHDRDYGEGVAYREYFATDELMFTIPKLDSRLKNKAEVLALRFGGASAVPTAISAAYLRKNPIHQGRLGNVSYVILTDRSGANRVFESDGVAWETYANDRVSDGTATWKVTEDGLVGPSGEKRRRLSAHRAFWFGWHAAHPNTVLVQ